MDNMNYCRFCGKLKSNTELIGIFNKNRTDSSYKSIGWIIYKCFRITIKTDDHLSKLICSNCSEQTMSTIKFYEQIIETEKFLKNLYMNEKNSQDDSNKDSKEIATIFRLDGVNERNWTETSQNEYNDENESDEMIVKKERHSSDDDRNHEDKIKTENYTDNVRHSDSVVEKYNHENSNSDAIIKKDSYSDDDDLSNDLIDLNIDMTHDFFNESKMSQPFDPDLHLKLMSDHNDSITLKERRSNRKKIKLELKTDDHYKLKSISRKIKRKPEKPKTETQIKRAEILKKVAEEFADYVWRCHVCSSDFKTKNELVNHFKIDHERKPEFFCLDCSKIYTKGNKFKWHVRTHRRNAEFRCKICDKWFIAECYLKDHIRFVHEYKDNDRIKCPVCHKGYKTKTALRTHDLYVHKGKNDELECDICAKKFKNKYFLRIHKETHEEKKFICEICGNKFRSKSNLNIHITSKHSNEDGTCTHICTFCSKNFKTSFHLSNHMRRIHQKGFKHQCDVCGKKFRNKNTLSEHHTSHTGELPHTCQFCQKKFRLKKTMQVHLRQHTGERPYSCKECNRDFVCSSNYLKHKKRKHSGINKIEN